MTTQTQLTETMDGAEMVKRMRRHPDLTVEEHEKGELDPYYFVRVRGSPRISGVIQKPHSHLPVALTIDYSSTFSGKEDLATEEVRLMELECVRTHALQSGIQPRECYPKLQSRGEYIAQLRDMVDGLSRLVGDMK